MVDELVRTYRGRHVFGPFAPFAHEELGVLERETGRPLPADYAAFLEVANGGRLEYAIRVPPGPEGEVVGFSDLYRLGRDSRGEYTWGTLLGEYRRQSDWWLAGEMPMAHLLPIARTGGEDDTLFLDLGADSYGRVCAFVSGLPLSWGRRTENVFAVVAPTFDDYLDTLHLDVDIAEDSWADVAGLDPSDPNRLNVKAWLDDGLPGWTDEPWAKV
jgi:hypothetical protein